jgi:hypothetical protein
MFGTATPIDEHRYLTARHVLPVDSTWHRLDKSISNHEVLQHGRGIGLVFSEAIRVVPNR